MRAVHMVRRNIARGVIATLLLTALPVGAQNAASGYPKGPVRVILPFPAGGGVDAAGRILAQKLSESLGKSFVIENRGVPTATSARNWRPRPATTA